MQPPQMALRPLAARSQALTLAERARAVSCGLEVHHGQMGEEDSLSQAAQWWEAK